MANVKTIIRKGLSNKNDYLLHTLQNGMKCLLISQPENECKTKMQESTHNKSSPNCSIEYDDKMTDGSFNNCLDKEELKTRSKTFAMSLSVHVGSFNDPIEAQGLAHLLEHMISMGNEYSGENHFAKINSLNAHTGCEHTIFHFTAQIEHFWVEVDKFTSFFQTPKLDKKSIDKEKQIVDSEFQMTITNDDVRMKRLLSLCASKNCPAEKFACGNLKSLNHENLDKMVFDFWKNHYSANRMFLAVQSQKSTHEMVELIDDLFSKIPTGYLLKPEMTFKVPFDLKTFHKIYKIVTVGSINKITFFWYLPPILNLYKYKPLEYIAWIVHHKGKGSLINYLRKLNYATELYAGVANNFFSNSIYSLFSITIQLTDLGFENVDMVIELTFSYLALIRQQGISEDIFKQIQTLAENEFNFAENENVRNHVIELSINMINNYDEEHYLCGPILFFEYVPKIIETYLKLMTVNRVALFIFSKNYDKSDFFLIDEMFGTNYLNDNFKEGLENKWSKVTPHPFFKIPSKNQYVTSDFSILPQSTFVKYPQKILENKHIELWHKQDNCFKLPKGYIMLNFITQIPSKSLENNIHLDLFLCTIVFLLNEDTYPTRIAQLNYSIQIFIHGFELTFEGFNEKLPLLIDIVINCIRNYKNLITEEIFNMVKSQAINKLKDKKHDLNYIVSDLTYSLLLESEWNLDSKLCCLEKLEYSQLLTFYEQLLSNLYCQALIQGNINQNQAIDISKKVVSTLNYQPLDKKCFPVVLVKRLRQGDYRVKLANYNRFDNNSTTYKYYQFDKCEITESMKYHVLQSIMEESAFDELRTKQCLGYKIKLNVTSVYQHYGFHFQVTHQKNKFKTQYVLSKMNEFLKQFWENFNKPEVVNEVRNALIAYRSSDKCLETEFNKNKNEILNNQFKFNVSELELEALKNLTFEDIANLKHGFLSGNTLSVEVIGNSTTESLTQPPIKKLCLEENKNYIYITDLDEFKNSLNSF